MAGEGSPIYFMFLAPYHPATGSTTADADPENEILINEFFTWNRENLVRVVGGGVTGKPPLRCGHCIFDLEGKDAITNPKNRIFWTKIIPPPDPEKVFLREDFK